MSGESETPTMKVRAALANQKESFFAIQLMVWVVGLVAIPVWAAFYVIPRTTAAMLMGVWIVWTIILWAIKGTEYDVWR